MGFWARKVQIFDDRILYKGLNKSFGVNLNDIKSIGVFLQLRYNRVLIKPEKINKYSIWGVKFLYISTNENPNLNTKINDEFICFQYRQLAYELILSRLKKTLPNTP